VETLLAALAVNRTRRSSPVRKFGADAGLLARLVIIFNWQQRSRLCHQRQRSLPQILILIVIIILIKPGDYDYQ
jgi:hypothetical protein